MCEDREGIAIACHELFSLGVRSKCNSHHYEMYFSDYKSFCHLLNPERVHQIITSASLHLSSILFRSFLSTGNTIATTFMVFYHKFFVSRKTGCNCEDVIFSLIPMMVTTIYIICFLPTYSGRYNGMHNKQ
mgnify:CR=1 FL=1